MSDRSIVTNSQAHVRKSIVFNLDLQDFFPSINFGRVRGMFMSFPFRFPAEVSTVLAQLCCHNEKLPQGAPTSPIVSNLICRKLDSELQGLARKFRCTYTRYADDITFSAGSSRFSDKMLKINLDESDYSIEAGPELMAVIEGNGFRVNREKVRVSKKSRRQVVTGLTVNRAPNVKRTYVRQIRAMLHAWKKHGIVAAEKEYYEKYNKKQMNCYRRKPSFKRVVRGKIEFLRMVKGESDLVYRNLANKYYQLTQGRSKYITDPIEAISAALWVLASDESEAQGTGFMLKDWGLITCHHVLSKGMYAFRHDNVLPESCTKPHLSCMS